MFIVLPIVVIVIGALVGLAVPAASVMDPLLLWSMVIGGGLVMIGVIAKALLGD